MAKNPKVLIGIVCSNYHEYCLEEFLTGLEKLTYVNKDILFVDNSKKDNFSKKLRAKGYNVLRIKFIDGAYNRIVLSRNLLRDYFLRGDYEYFFSLEQDIIPPKDIIERLLILNKPISTGLYFMVRQLDKRGETIQPMAFIWQDLKENKIRRLLNKEIKERRFITVISGMGCLLIHKDVLKKIKFKWDEKTKTGEDILFAQDCKDNNIKIIMDTSLKCKHLIKDRPWYLDFNKSEEPIFLKKCLEIEKK